MLGQNSLEDRWDQIADAKLAPLFAQVAMAQFAANLEGDVFEHVVGGVVELSLDGVSGFCGHVSIIHHLPIWCNWHLTTFRIVV